MECYICYEDEDTVLATDDKCSCKEYYYHPSCLYKWVARHRTCPTCREDIFDTIMCEELTCISHLNTIIKRCKNDEQVFKNICPDQVIKEYLRTRRILAYKNNKKITPVTLPINDEWMFTVHGGKRSTGMVEDTWGTIRSGSVIEVYYIEAYEDVVSVYIYRRHRPVVVEEKQKSLCVIQ